MFSVGVGTYGFETIWIMDFAGGGNLEIGKYCSIASPITVVLNGQHDVNRVTTYPLATKLGLGGENNDIIPDNGVVIGNDVWIGYNATIMSGVTIGDGAVIGAYANVTKDIPPYSIAVGNPIKIIRKRFTDEQIDKLLKIRWWDWEVDKIKEYADLLMSPNIDAFINKAELQD